MNETILVVGASGKFAGLVLPELAKRGANLRGLVHRATDSNAARAAGAQDVIVGDLSSPDSVAAALMPSRFARCSTTTIASGCAAVR